jgi:hypothetical protein
MQRQPNAVRRALLLGAPAAAMLSTSARAGSSHPATAPAVDAAPRAEFAYEALVTLHADIAHGRSPYGERTRAPITGGWFRGPAIAGRIVPGGADWQLLRADGYLVLDADYFMAADDGTQIHVRNKGLWHSPNNDWPADYALTTPEFEAPMGKHDWLNKHVFVCSVGPGPDASPAVRLRVYRMLGG